MINLDNYQEKAVYSSKNKSLLILAPPGAGKTFVMAKRIEFLIKMQAVAKPYKILGLTFSNTAADEMKKRVISEVPQSKGIVHITNFHSFAFLVLKAYGNKVDLKRNFSVMGKFESEALIKEKLGISHFFSHDKSDPLRKRAENIFNKYKKWKTERILKLNENYEDKHYQSNFEMALKTFRMEMISDNKVDFDHILYYAYELLKNNKSVLNYYRGVFKYILIDEFQDTNPIQFRLLELMVNGNNSNSSSRPVFILADPNQGIYEFQGANPKNIEDALKSFDCEVLELINDYRSDSLGIKIFKDAISTFIEEKKLILTPLPLDKPVYKIFPNKKKESEYIIEKIESFKADNVELHEIAILAPQGYNLNFIRSGIDQNEYIFLPDFKANEIERKYNLLFSELNVTSGSTESLENTILEICENNRINADDDVVQILIKLSRKYDKKYDLIDLTERIRLFKNEVLLEMNWGEIIRREVKNKIFLSTIHSAKGLEFERVIVCGVESGSIPFFPHCGKCNGVELNETKWIKSLKLLNVGISRGKLKLYLSSSNKNNWNRPTHPSCILKPFYYYLN